jgi:hypothetical protein
MAAQLPNAGGVPVQGPRGDALYIGCATNLRRCDWPHIAVA